MHAEKTWKKKKWKSELNLYFKRCGAVVCAQGFFVRMQGVEMFDV